MNYPLDKTEFIAWAKHRSPNELLDLKLILLASQADLQIQLQTRQESSGSDWHSRAKTKLRLTEWRLDIVEVLLDTHHAFQKAAFILLDRDTYDTILEAANAQRVS